MTNLAKIKAYIYGSQALNIKLFEQSSYIYINSNLIIKLQCDHAFT